jgi:hypothetical protein
MRVSTYVDSLENYTRSTLRIEGNSTTRGMGGNIITTEQIGHDVAPICGTYRPALNPLHHLLVLGFMRGKELKMIHRIGTRVRGFITGFVRKTSRPGALRPRVTGHTGQETLGVMGLSLCEPSWK